MRISSVAVMLCLLCTVTAIAQLPDHPVITEVYVDPPGLNDGPVGRDPGNPHQEFIEIYLPAAAALSPSLNKDALRLTFYEVEGDENSTGPGTINYRFDLPTFDLDASNGITAGALERPPSGVVVLGWVDYAGSPPTGLAGTPGSRVALVHGGITSTGGDYTFIAINGAQFGGTTNFPVPAAESLIDLPSEASSGVVQNGSGVYLLVDRDASGYVELCDDQHAGDCGAGSNPALPNDGAGLSTFALLDGFAANDHPDFVVDEQPYDPPTGDDIDLENELPLFGAFSFLIAQVPEEDTTRITPGFASGYHRLFPDVAKTTETFLDDDPVADALNAYRHVRDEGPFYPSPGSAPLTSSAPELSVAVDTEHDFVILSQTTGGAGILAANVGGDFGIDMAVTSVTSDNPAVLAMSAGPADLAVPGRTLGFPNIAMTPTASAANGTVVTSSATVTGTNSQGGDPAVIAPVWNVNVTATVLDPVTGINAVGQPFEATVFAAVQGIVADTGVTNEFLNTDLGAFLAAQPDPDALSAKGNAALMVDPATDWSSPFVLPPVVDEFPGTCCDYIDPLGAPGTPSLLQKVQNSVEMQTGAGTYDDAIETCSCPEGTQTAVKAISVNHPDSFVYGGDFATSQTLHFVEPRGFVGNPRSGLSNATTDRTFELALVDTHVSETAGIESGATDDFGIVLEVELTEPGAAVVDGELVFLSFTGGFEGADIDTLQVPPGDLLGVIVYLDLDNLHDVLGIRSIERIILVDGSGNGELDLLDAFCLNPTEPTGCVPAECNDNQFCNGVESCNGGSCFSPGDPCAGAGLTCDEGSDSCICTNAGQCDDGLFCSGVESCNGGNCVSSGNPCSGMGQVCNEATDSCVDTPQCPNGTVEECADIDGNGARDDNCVWWACVGGTCESTEIPFADMGGQFGSCPPDGTADGNDRFQALNCFSNVDTAGNFGFPCEVNPPVAFNVDAGGQFGSCVPDGVCDGNDAFAALNAFSEQTTCSCPLGGPAPSMSPGHPPLRREPSVVGRTGIRMQPSAKRLRPGGFVDVDVVLGGGLDDLRGYQLHLGVTGGRSGRLQLVDITVHDRKDLAFEGLADWQAFNLDSAQMVAGLDGPGIAAGDGAYLATFTYRADDDASGTFTVELLADPRDAGQRTFLFPSAPHGRIDIAGDGGATVTVTTRHDRRAAK